MANDDDSRSADNCEPFGGSIPRRFAEACGALRFVLDGHGRFASADAEFGRHYGALIQAGDGFDAERVIPSDHVRTAVQMALAGQTPERRLVLFPLAEDSDSVWIFEAIPFEAPQLAEGKGVAGLFVRCEVSSEQSTVEDMLMSVTLAERLARERLGTAKAIVAKIRHEIGNALTTIIGNAELIMRKAPASDAATAERIQEILSQGRRIQSVIERLDALSDVRTTNHYGSYEMLDLENGASANPRGDG